MSEVTNVICLLLIFVLSGPLSAIFYRYFGKYFDRLSPTKSALVVGGILIVDLIAGIGILNLMAHG